MAKKKSLESESKDSGPKRKNLSSDETKVCVEENMESKVRKKRKKTEREEDATLQIPEISVKADDNTKEKKRKKHKQTSEQTKKKKKNEKQIEIAESPPDPVATQERADMEGEEDLSPEEQRILERKMKKILKKEEKDRVKAEGKTEEKVEASRPIAPQQALDYLTCWAENRKEWKFQKTRQTWLLQHMFDSEKIPDKSFSALLMYLEGLRGAARDTTVQKAEALVRELGEGTEDGDAQQRAHRAREVIQLLS